MNRWNSHRTLRAGAVRALSLAIVVAGATGCQGAQNMKSAKDVGSTADAVDTPMFVAPYDPDMERVKLVVDIVQVTAPVNASIGDISATVRSQFIATLGSSANFVVTDPEAYDRIGQGQELAASGAADPADQPAPGRLVIPRYIVKVNVTELQESVVGEVKDDDVGLGVIAWIVSLFLDNDGQTVAEAVAAADPQFKNKRMRIHGVVGLETRVTDAETGTVVLTTRSQASLTQESVATGWNIAGIGSRSGNFSQSVAAHATRRAVEDAVLKLHAALRDDTRVAMSAATR